jgi:hypothetical protein
MDVNGEMPLVKIYIDGQVWKIWSDGRAAGFPPDALIVNHALDISIHESVIVIVQEAIVER